MNNRNHILAFVLLILLPAVSSAQDEQRIRLIELYSDLGGNYEINYNGTFTPVAQHGFGINTTLGRKHGGLFGSYTYRLTDIEDLVPGAKNTVSHEFFMGSRYYPMIPTFLIGPTALRLTGTAAIGCDWNFDLRFMYQVGFEISPVRSTIGVTVHFYNSLGTFNTEGYPGKSFWALRLGFMLGPSMK